MSGIHDNGNYANPGTNGQNNQSNQSYDSKQKKAALVRQYYPKIEATLQERATGVNVMRKESTVSSLTKPQEIHTSLDEGFMQNEVDKFCNNFISEAKKAQEERLAIVETRYKDTYQNQLEVKNKEIDRAYRIINIQTAIMSRLNKQNPELIPKILLDADISEDDLAFLIDSK